MDHDTPPARTRETLRKVYVRGLELSASIGAYASEYDRLQPIRIDFELEVDVPTDPASEKLEDIVCYDEMSRAVRAILSEGHIRLVETLAERIASVALAHPMVRAATIRVEKLTAVKDAAASGVEIRREKI